MQIKKTILCDILGWHTNPICIEENGDTICPLCNKEILTDSQGNYFERVSKLTNKKEVNK